MTSAPIIRLEAVSKSYHLKNGELAALSNISLSVSDGAFVCIVGPSGCGKTTLLRLMGGLTTPTSGSVWFKDAELSRPQPGIGFVFQQASLMPWRTVFQNVRLPLQLQNLAPHEADFRTHAALEMVGLAEFAAAHPHELSGGMEQRVAIARALVHEPDLLLLDEPFGALDALTRERLNQELLRLWQANGHTAIMVTHDIREAVFLADRVLVLSRRPGRIVADIPIELPRPRTSGLTFSEVFSVLCYQVRQAISLQ